MINLKKFRTAKNLSQVKVAEDIGISRQTYNNYELGKRQADYETLLRLAEYFDVSVEELLTDKPAAPLQPNILPLASIKVRMCPVFESVSAGFGAYADDSIIEYMPLFIESDTEAKETIVVKVVGDSMYPKIENGDLIQVHRQDWAENGQVAVVMIDTATDSTVVKQYFADSETVTLRSFNPEYAPKIYQGREIEELRILGVVRKVIKEL